MKAFGIKTVAPHILGPALLALAGSYAAGTVEAAESEVQPTPQAILSAIGALQTSVNNLQTKVEGLQSTSSNLQSRVQTLQSNLSPAWGQTLAGAVRFAPALDGAAVLDLETGLVWEQKPDATPTRWTFAHNRCSTNVIAGRMGWRLPTVEELTSLVDPTQPTPSLPAGHPFSLQPTGFYWASTGFVGDTGAQTDENADLARLVTFKVESPNGHVLFGVKVESNLVWCVRGGQQADAQ
jgi:hypothetical protein